MKIVTYNLRFGGKAGKRIHWRQIFQEVNPDIFLVQETCDPQLYLSTHCWEKYSNQIQWIKIDGRTWGSAVFVHSAKLELITIPDFAECLVGIEVHESQWSAKTGRSLRIFSLHAPVPYKRAVNQILDLIATLSDDCDLIIGGDFNLTTGKRHSSEGLQDNTL